MLVFSSGPNESYAPGMPYPFNIPVLSASNYEYAHRDHLGSLESVTDGNGNRLAQLAFEPYGERKAADWSGNIGASELNELMSNGLEWQLMLGQPPVLLEQASRKARGFTGHEHLDRTGFVHMNGRVFDPQLGRFLSPDPVVQAPTMSQNWNSFSYVFNSPTGFVDPSGFECVLAVTVITDENGEEITGPGIEYCPPDSDPFTGFADLRNAISRGYRLGMPILKFVPGGKDGDGKDGEQSEVDCDKLNSEVKEQLESEGGHTEFAKNIRMAFQLVNRNVNRLVRARQRPRAYGAFVWGRRNFESHEYVYDGKSYQDGPSRWWQPFIDYVAPGPAVALPITNSPVAVVLYYPKGHNDSVASLRATFGHLDPPFPVVLNEYGEVTVQIGMCDPFTTSFTP